MENIIVRGLRRLRNDPVSIYMHYYEKVFGRILPDELYLKLYFRIKMHKRLDLKNPTTFNEKLQWLKLYDRNPEYTRMVDKYEVKKLVADAVGDEYLIPLYGVWDNFDDINFDSLPDSFVLKTTHGSGGVIIVRDKAKLDFAEAGRVIRLAMKTNYFYGKREWPYKNVRPRIIAEKYMTDESGVELKDYKVLCFNGIPKLVEIHRGRFGKHYQDIYDVDCNKTEFVQPADPPTDIVIDKPVFWDEMIEKSAVLAKNIAHVRVDWYYAEGQLYFGELTFFDGAGFAAFIDNQDEIVGSWLELPPKYSNR